MAYNIPVGVNVPYGAYRGSNAPFSNTYKGAKASRRYEQTKHSGSRFTRIDEKTMVVSGWKKFKNAFATFYARPYEKTRETESKTGKIWRNLFVTIKYPGTTRKPENTSAMLDVNAKRLYFNGDVCNGMIATLGGKGGYWGKGGYKMSVR